MDITDEMRRAVHLEDCAELGHAISTYTAIQGSYVSPINARNEIDGPENHLPYLKCTRCGSVWIVLPEIGADYDDAERILFDRLNPISELARRIARLRGRRERPIR